VATPDAAFAAERSAAAAACAACTTVGSWGGHEQREVRQGVS